MRGETVARDIAMGGLDIDVDRRAILLTAGLGASAVLVSCGRTSASDQLLSDAEIAMLVQVARDLYPHRQFPAAVYRDAVVAYRTAAAHDDGLAATLRAGIETLDRTARNRFGTGYRGLSKAGDRVALLKGAEQGPLVARMSADLNYRLYNDHRVWKILGYPGASSDFGGYQNADFGVVPWLTNRKGA